MKVFVAGATGVIGRRAVTQMVEAGHEVTALARSDEKARSLELAGVRASRASIFDREPLAEAMGGHQAVVNLATHIPKLTRAALPGVWKENDRLRSEGSANLVDGALRAGAEVYVQESVSFVYDDAGDAWIDETGVVTPVPYIRSVLEAQANTERFTADGGRGIFLRFAMFYAPDSHHTRDYLRWARRGFSLEPGDPRSYKSMIHADDAAAAVVSVLEAPAGTYNVSDDEPLRRGEHDELMARLAGRSSLRRTMDRLSRLAGSKVEILKRSQRITNARLKQTTGWRPRYPSVRDGLALVVTQIEQESPHA